MAKKTLDKKFQVKVIPEMGEGTTAALVKAKDGTIVPADEFVVFLAKDDAFALYALPEYRRACILLNADNEQQEAVSRLIQDVTQWRSDNPTKCKTPDAAGERLLP